jgi:hypothetical protein
MSYSCTTNSKKTSFIIEYKDKTSLTDDSSRIKELCIYSPNENYENRLSSLASSIEFVPLASEPLISDFHVLDIAVCNDYIFLSGLSYIYQYDKAGNFIRSIGNRGMGPEEYINISYPLQIDKENSLIYVTDINRGRIVIYHFNGSFKKTIPLLSYGCIDLIDPNFIAIRQTIAERGKPDCAAIRFMNYEGEIVKNYRSNIYPLKSKNNEMLGSDMSRVWRHRGNIYFLEYASDTVFRIQKDSIIPIYSLTGELKLNESDYFKQETGSKSGIITYIMRPNSGVFESDNFIIFRMGNDYEKFFMIYDKTKSQYYRTFYKDAIPNMRGNKNMDYFIDDIVSGLPFNPQYQSADKAIAIVSAETISKHKPEIINFMSSMPLSDTKQHLETSLKQINEDDNPYLMIVSFK